jgi:hypothetical protein
MSKLAFLLPLAAVLAGFLAAPSRAESLSCSSVNGVTLCSRSGSTSCQSVNGKTTCCETVGNRTECHDTPAANPPRQLRPHDRDQEQDRDRGRDQDRDDGQPDDDDLLASPLLLLPGRTVDISSTILSILLLEGGIHPAVQGAVLPVIPDQRPSRIREILIADTIRHNQEMLLRTGKKLPFRRCITNCGAFNSLDRWHRP